MSSAIDYFLLRLCMFFFFPVFVSAQPINNPVADIELIISSTAGNNGVAVMWNPDNNLYYTAFGGNADFTLDVFSPDGKCIHSQSIGLDIRGLNYSRKSHCLIGNAYDDKGYFRILLDENGIPVSKAERYLSGMHQPAMQSVGMMDESEKLMYFREGLTIFSYRISDGKNISSFPLIGISESEINKCVGSCILYTAVSGFEFAVVNLYNAKTYFFDLEGRFVHSISISYALEIHDNLNLSFANNHIWFYNKELRKWTGYKVF